MHSPKLFGGIFYLAGRRFHSHIALPPDDVNRDETSKKTSGMRWERLFPFWGNIKEIDEVTI